MNLQTIFLLKIWMEEMNETCEEEILEILEILKILFIE